MHDLSKIIQIRNGKLKKASSVERVKQQKLDVTENKLRQACQAIDDFSLEMQGLEKALLEGVLRKEVTAADMMMIENILKEASQQASKLVDEAKVVEQEIDSCREALEDARAKRITLNKRLDNITEVDQEMRSKARKQLLKTLGRKEQNAMDEAFMSGRA